MPLEKSDWGISEEDTGEPVRLSGSGISKRGRERRGDRWRLRRYYRNHRSVRQRDTAPGARGKKETFHRLQSRKSVGEGDPNHISLENFYLWLMEFV